MIADYCTCKGTPIPYPTGKCMECGGTVPNFENHPANLSARTCGCDMGAVDSAGKPKPYFCEQHR